MSIYSTKINPEYCEAHKDAFTGNVFIRFEEGLFSSFHALEITSPVIAHRFREAVNKGVDIYLGNDKKGL